MKRNKIIAIVARIVGVVILLTGLRMIGEGVYNYIDEHNQKDWVSISAYVVDVKSEYSHSSTKRTSRARYDITYQYEVDGIEYSDILYNRSKPLAIGDTVKIKYDPDLPSDSTDILSPSIGNMALFIGFGGVLSLVGFFLSGIWALIQRIRRKGQPIEKEELPPEEYITPDNNMKKPKSVSKALVLKIASIVVALGVIMISIKFFPGTKSVDIQTFRVSADAAGYVTENSTTKLREEWRVDSMLVEAASFDNGKIRMDFCVMDTADSSENLYDGMTLPLTDGEVIDSSGMIHEFYSVENETNYVAKIRIRDTIIYVSALSECKNDVIKILDELGYWKE